MIFYFVIDEKERTTWNGDDWISSTETKALLKVIISFAVGRFCYGNNYFTLILSVLEAIINLPTVDIQVRIDDFVKLQILYQSSLLCYLL